MIRQFPEKPSPAIAAVVILSFLTLQTVPAAAQKCTDTNWTVFATGLTNPRLIRFGPDGLLYVAEAGVGGAQLGTCPWEGNLFNQTSAYMGGYTGRISRILPDGTRQIVADGLPGFIDGFGDALGVSDVAWIGQTLYALIEGGGCTRGLPDDPSGIVRINDDGSYTYVADITSFIRNNPVNSEPPCGPLGDCEPDGVPHSMMVKGNKLLVVETNHNSILRVNPATGAIKRLYDLSVQDPAPIILTRKGKKFYLGSFDGLIQTFDNKVGPVCTFDEGYGPIVDLTVVGKEIFILETFALETPWAPDTGRVVRRHKDGSRTVIACGLNFPIGMARGDDGAWYVSTFSFGQGPVEGLGQIVRIEASGDDDD
jgi:hypothetical protein